MSIGWALSAVGISVCRTKIDLKNSFSNQEKFNN